MSFGDAFYSVIGSAAGSALVGGVMDLFTDDTPVPARAQVRGSTAGQTAVSKATDLASLTTLLIIFLGVTSKRDFFFLKGL